MRDTILHSLLNPPEVEEATADVEASGSGTIGGEVYAGTLGGAPTSLTVGHGCTYVASDTVTMESSESHLDIHSPAAAVGADVKVRFGALHGHRFACYVCTPVPDGEGGRSSSQGAGVDLTADRPAARDLLVCCRFLHLGRVEERVKDRVPHEALLRFRATEALQPRSSRGRRGRRQ